MSRKTLAGGRPGAESLDHETAGLDAYRELLALVEGRSVLVEEYVRRMISDETRHIGEVEKMLRPPGTPLDG